MNIDKVLELIETDFKGKAMEGSQCKYKTDDGRKCFIGLFLPEGHAAQKEEDMNVRSLLGKYPDLRNYMPSDDLDKLNTLQRVHDSFGFNGIDEMSLTEQKFYLQLRALDVLGE